MNLSLRSSNRRDHQVDYQPYIWALLFGLTLGLATVVSPLAGVGLILGAISIFIILRKPIVLCFMHIMAVIWLSGMPRDYLIPVFVPNEPILLVVAAIGFLIIILGNRGGRTPTMLVAALAIFVVGTSILPLVLFILRGFKVGVGEAFALIAPVQYLVVLWLFANLPKNDDERMEVLQIMYLGSIMVSLSAIGQYLHIGFIESFIVRFYPSLQSETAAEYGRVTSILNAWNSLGNYLMITLILIVLTYPLIKKRWQRYNTMAAAGIGLLTLFLSGSFASIGGLLIAYIITLYFDRRGVKQALYLAGVMIVVGIIMAPLIATRLEFQFGGGGGSNSLVPQTLAQRFKLWDTIFIPALLRNNNWIWGITPNVFASGIFTWGWTENQYLYMMIRSGLISLVAHLIWAGMLMIWLYRRIKKETPGTLSFALVLGSLSLLTTLTVMGMTNEVFTNSGSIDHFWMLLGLTVKAGVNDT
ncbi:MAG: hypothetical protein IT320_23320 [Anaerolineae bacterium]|nr:hypothetical protein [Anaerolineae bacterium]